MPLDVWIAATEAPATGRVWLLSTVSQTLLAYWGSLIKVFT